MKITIEMVEGLRNKLRLLGVSIEDLCSVVCKIDSDAKNVTRPESLLNV